MQFSEEEFNEILRVFESEVEESLTKINDLLLRLEKDNNDFYAVQELFREAHSIKGAARMVGFLEIQNLAHAFENVMGLKKDEEINMTPDIVDLLCSAVDCIENIIEENIKTKGAYRSDEAARMIEKLNNISSIDTTENEITKEDIQGLQCAENTESCGDESTIGNLQGCLSKLQNLTDNLFAKDRVLNNDLVDILCVIKEIKSYDIEKSALSLYEKIYNLVERIKQNDYLPDKEFFDDIKRAVELGKDIINGNPQELDEISLLEKRLMILVEIVDISQIQPSGDSTTHQPVDISKKPSVEPGKISQEEFIMPVAESLAIKTLRVDANKLDKLVNQVGELIIAKIKTQDHATELEKLNESLEDLHKILNKSRQYIRFHDKKKDSNASEMIFRNVQSISDDAAYRVSELMNKVADLYRVIQEDDTRLSLIVGDLENLIKGIRLLPFATVFHMFPRMVRDIAREKGKQAELIITGSETSADKKIIEEIKAPLVHIIRNAVDHGIESTDERIAAGKNPVGRIELSARHVENSIIIEIKDDGNGIDIQKIKQRVLEKELLSEPELDAMTPSQIMNIIFWPGFSTEEEITDISGRGVGLDIVHAKISQLNGKVNVKSELGHRCTVTIQLPVTMATIKAFLINLSDQIFALSANSISMVRRINTSEIFIKEGYKHIVYEDRAIPVFYLSDVLNFENDIKSDKAVVIFVKEDDNEVGFIVNTLLGEQEILHKNLEPPLIRVKNVSGIATLASGEICLVLNSSGLIKSAFNLKNMTALPRVKQEVFTPSDYDILLVEDSLTTRVLQRNILLNRGYKVDSVANAEDALKKINEKKYQMIISDIEMPGMNGIDFMQRIKKEVPNSQKIKKMLVSFLDNDETRHQASLAEVDYFMHKGAFEHKEFLNVVEKLLRR